MIYLLYFTVSAPVLICADAAPLARSQVNINFIKCNSEQEWCKNTRMEDEFLDISLCCLHDNLSLCVYIYICKKKRHFHKEKYFV